MLRKIDFSKLKSFAWTTAIIILIVLFFATAEKTGEIPEWYKDQPENTELYLYGIGEGYNLEIAKELGLKNLISHIINEDNLNTLPLWKRSNYKNSTEFNDKINDILRTIIITDYETVQSKYLNEKVYVVLAIKKDRFVENNINKIIQINSEINNLNNESIDQHIFLRRKTLIKINKRAEHAEKITKVLKNLTKNSSFKKNLKTYKDFQDKYNYLNKIIKFYVKGENVPESIIKAFEDGVYNTNLTLANKLNESDRNLTVINLESTTKTEAIFKTINTKINITISVENGKGKQLSTTKLEINGNSTINEKEAIKNASTNLAKIIEQEGLIKLIGGEN